MLYARSTTTGMGMLCVWVWACYGYGTGIVLALLFWPRLEQNGFLLKGNKIPTWGIIDILDRRSCSPISVSCTPSISRTPSGSAIRNREVNSEDLPAPLRPMTPIWGWSKKTGCHRKHRPMSIICATPQIANTSPPKLGCDMRTTPAIPYLLWGGNFTSDAFENQWILWTVAKLQIIHLDGTFSWPVLVGLVTGWNGLQWSLWRQLAISHQPLNGHHLCIKNMDSSYDHSKVLGVLTVSVCT